MRAKKKKKKERKLQKVLEITLHSVLEGIRLNARVIYRWWLLVVYTQLFRDV